MPAITAAAKRKAVGERLAAARRAAGRSQVDVAKSTGLDQRTISRAERGEACGLSSLLTIAAELGVDLLGDQ